MATDLDTVTASLGSLHVTSLAQSRPSLPYDQSLESDLERLVQISQETIAKARQVSSTLSDTELSLTHRVAALSSLRTTTEQLSNDVMAITDTVDESILSCVRTLAKNNLPVLKLLEYFRHALMQTIQDVLNSNRDHTSTLWRVLEECFNRSIHESGSLNIDGYFIEKEEACLESPYDPDFESEEYYEHENRLLVDEEYAHTERMRQERVYKQRNEARKTERWSWISFWVNAMAGCPGGPTLFWPSTEDDLRSALNDVPRYLFRTFDHNSSGNSDDTVVASAASIDTRPKETLANLLSLSPDKVSKRLSIHLKKECFQRAGEGTTDNLMSWSSSFLFVVQYAIWRNYYSGTAPADVKICVVDTTRFPRQQFARDNWLMREYANAADERIQGLLRLRQIGYDNGEYLSQGIVHHRNRSCVISLGSLIAAGFFDLYPEFEEADGKSKWAKRVRELRVRWQVDSIPSTTEVRLAYKIATTCFSVFDATDIALLLLMFQNRHIVVTQSSSQSHQVAIQNTIKMPVNYSDYEFRSTDDFAQYGPEEVRRFYQARESFQAFKGSNTLVNFMLFRGLSRLERFFGYTDASPP